ncbi:MAG: hypothetical protein J0H08_18340, partial [Rhizobiales bacterium]|nr:hypothetical protein [Hyphomicrobiales bacterium]
MTSDVPNNDLRSEVLDDLYSSSDLSLVMPRYTFPPTEHDPKHAFAVVRDELMLDGNARQNLAT